MFIALTTVTVALAVMAALSAVMKLTNNEQSIDSIHHTVGVPVRYFPVLAGLELAGAVGILLGLWSEPVGVAAAIGLVVYFLGAMVAHLRVRDTKGAVNPVLPLVLAIAVLSLRIATL